jgi:hypothetical protein
MVYCRLNNAQLLVEAIRRCRVRQIPSISYTAFAAAKPGSVIEALSGLMDRHAFRGVMNGLIADKTICVTCRVNEFKEGWHVSHSVTGLLRQFHPELPFDDYQYFSPAGIPKRRNEKTVPGSTSLSIRGLYVIADGVPAKVQKLLEKCEYIYPI